MNKIAPKKKKNHTIRWRLCNPLEWSKWRRTTAADLHLHRDRLQPRRTLLSTLATPWFRSKLSLQPKKQRVNEIWIWSERIGSEREWLVESENRTVAFEGFGESERRGNENENESECEEWKTRLRHFRSMDVCMNVIYENKEWNFEVRVIDLSSLMLV